MLARVVIYEQGVKRTAICDAMAQTYKLSLDGSVRETARKERIVCLRHVCFANRPFRSSRVADGYKNGADRYLTRRRRLRGACGSPIDTATERRVISLGFHPNRLDQSGGGDHPRST